MDRPSTTLVRCCGTGGRDIVLTRESKLGPRHRPDGRVTTLRHIVPIIWETVGTDFATGEMLDHDSYCRKFLAMRPDLDRRVIETVVAEAMRFHSRAASSGDKPAG